MTTGCAIHRRQKRAGYLAASFFLAALLALVDSLSGGISGNRGLIELLPGSSYAISGPMPPKTDTIEGMVVTGAPEDGSVRLVPKNIFSGFWLGGSMWRGFLEVSTSAQQAEYRIQVKDRFGEKQNPALVFVVRVWPDQKTLNAHSSSFLTRATGINPFVFVLAFTLCGVATGILTFLLGRRWTQQLHRHACSEIYRLVTGKEGTSVVCEQPPGVSIAPGSSCSIHRPDGTMLAETTVFAVEKKDVVLLLTDRHGVRIGDVVCLQAATGAESLPSQSGSL